MTVLAPNKDGNNNDQLPETVPAWKEDIVERVRRRTAAARAAAEPKSPLARRPSASPRGGSGAAQRERNALVKIDGGDAYMQLVQSDEGASLWGGRSGGSPRRAPSSPRRGGMALGGLEEADESEIPLTSDVDKAVRREQEVRKRHAVLGYFRDAISDLVLTSQFQEADFAHRMAQVNKLLAASSAAGGTGGRMNAHKREGSDYYLIELEKKLTNQLHLFDSRASDAMTLNRNLEKIINELRRERADQLQTVRSKEAREQSMSADMRSFASAAHTALDEKERIKGRMRRLRYEWKQERGTQEAEQATLQREEDELEHKIVQATAEEEAAVQDETRREALVMRESYRKMEYRERRLGYLRNQLAALQLEMRRLGEIAGASGRSGVDGFRYEDPTTAHVLTRTLRMNDMRNESEHAFVQSMAIDVEALSNEVEELNGEESTLLAREEARVEVASAAATRAEKATTQHLEDATRFEELEAHMGKMSPLLIGTVERLAAAYSELDGARRCCSALLLSHPCLSRLLLTPPLSSLLQASTCVTWRRCRRA